VGGAEVERKVWGVTTDWTWRRRRRGYGDYGARKRKVERRELDEEEGGWRTGEDPLGLPMGEIIVAVRCAASGGGLPQRSRRRRMIGGVSWER